MKNILQHAIFWMCFIVFMAGGSAVAAAQDASVAGALTTPHPTLEHISVDWAVEGDANADGKVSVRFRPEGSADWRTGLDLVAVPGGSNAGHTWARRHSGSLFGLHPDTRYEIELTLTDPDGGGETRTVTAKTRPVPIVGEDAKIIQASTADANSAISAAQPGDVVVLAAGTYDSIYVRRSGEPGRPIVIRGSDPTSVVIQGEVRMDGQSHVWIENLSVRGQIKFNSATGIVIRGCRIDADGPTGDAIVSFGEGSTDGYFVDNIVIGQNVWAESSLGVSGDNRGEGIVMTGGGNVIAHNRVSGFRDCISLLEGNLAHNQVSIDILNNDLDNCVDDGIEVDYAMGNVRVMRNRVTNAFIGLSSQPSLGGPTWFVRNVLYNILFQAFKPHNLSAGDRWLHNTVLKPGDALGVYSSNPWSHAYFRNNLLIGGIGGDQFNGYSNGTGQVLDIATLETASSDFDYDGYGSIGTGRFSGKFGPVRFDSIEALRAETSEKHAVEVDLSIFAKDVEFPEAPFPAKNAPDLRLQPGAAVDKGVALPLINDGFSGQAPDLGAYELGSPLPEYGPRTDAPVCGNHILETGEECDDGNTTPGDGCEPDCTLSVEDNGETPDAGSGETPDVGDTGHPDAGGHDTGHTDTSPNPNQPDADGSDAARGPSKSSDGCGCDVGAGAPGADFFALAIFALACTLRRLGRSSLREPRP